MIGRYPVPQQPDTHALTRLLNKFREEIKRSGTVKAGKGIDVNTSSAGIIISAIGETKYQLWYNDHATECPAYGCIKITGLKSKDILKATRPDEDYNRCYAINSNKAVPAGEYGKCYVSGIIEMDARGNHPHYGDTWGPTKDSWTLFEGSFGFYCIGDLADNAGDQTLWIAEPPTSICAITDEELVTSGSATCSLYATPGSGLTDLDINAEVYEFSMLAGDTIAVGKRIIANWISNHWVVVQSECNTGDE